MAGLLLLLLVLPLGAPLAAQGLKRGERRTGDLVSLGQQVDVGGDLDGAIVLTGGRLSLAGTVRGDVILIGADADLAASARVEGDLLCVGGELRLPDGVAPRDLVKGRVVTLDAMESAFLAELRTSPLQVAAISPMLLSFRLLILTAWLLAGLLILYVRPRRLMTAASAADGRLLFLASLGVTAVLTSLLLSALLMALAPARVGFALVLALVGALAVAKLFGLAAIFLVLGRWLARRSRRGSALFGDPAALSLGLLALGLLSLVPSAGAVVWAMASLVGIGLSIATSFGRPAPV